METVERLSRNYGEEHVALKCYGFKPNFFVSLADEIIGECMFALSAYIIYVYDTIV